MPPFLLTWSPAANYGCQDDQIQYNNKTASNFTGCCVIQFSETHTGITSNCIKIYFDVPKENAVLKKYNSAPQTSPNRAPLVTHFYTGNWSGM